MVEFIELLFITSLWIWGVHGFMELSGVKDNFHLPLWITKSLFDCPPCMSSVHGSLLYWSYYTIHHSIFNAHILFHWPLFIFCLCGLNYIIKEHLYES